MGTLGDRAFQALLGLMLVLAWWLGSGALLAGVSLLGGAWGLGRYWGRHALDRVTYRRRFVPDRCFAGEPVTLEVEVTNRKLLPIVDLAVDDQVPEALALSGGRIASGLQRRAHLRHLLTAGWYMRVRRRYSVSAPCRGLYRLGPGSLQGGDPFGFAGHVREVPERVELLVYPPVLPLPAVGLPSRRPFGDLRSAEWLFPDPLRFAGVRDYTPGDPPARVHWRATAAAGRLQVKELEPSAQGGLAVFLDVWGFAHVWEGYDPAALERGVLAAAAAVNWAVEQGFAAGLYANGAVDGWGPLLRLAPARGPLVLVRALEGLARLTPVSSRSLAQCLDSELGSLPYGTAVLSLGRQVAPDLAAALVRARRRGHPVTVLVTGAGVPVPDLPGVRAFGFSGEVPVHGTD